jgi:hypothetical protein
LFNRFNLTHPITSLNSKSISRDMAAVSNCPTPTITLKNRAGRETENGNVPFPPKQKAGSGSEDA